MSDICPTSGARSSCFFASFQSFQSCVLCGISCPLGSQSRSVVYILLVLLFGQGAVILVIEACLWFKSLKRFDQSLAKGRVIPLSSSSHIDQLVWSSVVSRAEWFLRGKICSLATVQASVNISTKCHLLARFWLISLSSSHLFVIRPVDWRSSTLSLFVYGDREV